LDAGVGSSVLRSPASAQIVVDALLWFDSQRYALIAWCVMPNHVHAVIEPIGAHTLGQIVKSWKAFTAAKINKSLGRSGRLWAPDYFDRFMRSNEHLSTTITYVENNPVAASYVQRRRIGLILLRLCVVEKRCGSEDPRSFNSATADRASALSRIGSLLHSLHPRGA
jgi:REP element-mobilizing transposase RayT